MAFVSPTDFVFLSLEKRRQPMHVGCLFLFDVPHTPKGDFVYQLAQKIKESPYPPVAPFNWVLRNYQWQDDNAFDIEHHFRHIALPKPGRIRELLTYVSAEHSALLDRAKPLWEIHLIEGIEGNRFALYAKVHHGLVDGISAMRLIERSFSKSALQSDDFMPPWAYGFAALRRDKKETKSALIPTPQAPAALSKVGRAFRSFYTVGREIKNATVQAVIDPNYTSIFKAPSSVLNQNISASRRFAAQSYSLTRIKELAKFYKCTVNDLALCICAGALRQYLIQLDALPEKSLVAMVPVNIRQQDALQTGNHISMILTDLGTDIVDPIERIQRITNSISVSKQRLGRMTQIEILNYSGIVFSIPGFNLLTGIAPSKQAFNIVISNVPGPKERLYMDGAPLQAFYPVSVIMDGQAMNVTLTSYLDSIDVGIIACRKALPKVQNMLQLIQDELDALGERAHMMQKALEG